jgi:hypothetical protein
MERSVEIVDTEEFCAHYMAILFKNCTLNHDSECLIWQKCTNNEYGHMSYTVRIREIDTSITTVKRYITPHRLMFAIATNSLYLLQKEHANTEISHLCHQPLCCNISHLEAESKALNNSRTKCKNARVCHDHDPKCIF